MSGKSESSTDFSLTSSALIFRRLARSFRAFSTAEFLSIAIRNSNVPLGIFVPAISGFHFEPEIRYGQMKIRVHPRNPRLNLLKISKTMLQQNRDRNRSRLGPQDSSTKRHDMKISCPGGFDLFIGPATLGTNQGRY